MEQDGAVEVPCGTGLPLPHPTFCQVEPRGQENLIFSLIPSRGFCFNCCSMWSCEFCHTCQILVTSYVCFLTSSLSQVWRCLTKAAEYAVFFRKVYYLHRVCWTLRNECFLQPLCSHPVLSSCDLTAAWQGSFSRNIFLAVLVTFTWKMVKHSHYCSA